MRRRIRLGGYPPPLVVYGGLALGVSAVSSAAVIIRLADAPSLTIAAYRLVLASIIVVPLGMALEWGALRSLTRRQWGLVFAAAVCLAAHFAFWITSLEHTSVASSVVIVTSNPVLVAIGAAVLLRERTSARALAGVGVAIAGGVVIAVGDWDLGDRRLYGDLLALGGAVAVAGYYIAGRSLREQLSILGYIAPVYGTAAVLLSAAALATGAQLTGFDVEVYGWLVLLAAAAAGGGALDAELVAGVPARDAGGDGGDGRAGRGEPAGVGGARRGASGDERRGRRAGARGRVHDARGEPAG